MLAFWVSAEYQAFACWFLGSGCVGVGFYGFVGSSYPHLIPELSRDFASGSFLFLSALCSSPSSIPPFSQAGASTLLVPPPSSVPPLFPSAPAPAVPPFSVHLSAPSAPPHLRLSAPFPASSFSGTSASVPAPPVVSLSPPLPSLSFPPAAAPSSSGFPSTSSAAMAPSASSFRDPAVAPGLGVGVPLSSSSGVPPFSPFVAATPSVLEFSPSAATNAPDPHASYANTQLPSDLLSDNDDCMPNDDHLYVDPSTPPLSLDSSRSEYCCMAVRIVALFPQAAGAPPATPPSRALFESFFTSASPSPQLLSFNLFDRVCQVLVDADTRVSAFLAAGHSDCTFLPARRLSYAVRGEHASGKAVLVNESLLSYFDRQLRPSLLVDLSVKDAMALEASFLAQSEALSYSMWVLSGLLGFVRLQGFTPADPALFNQLVMALSKSFAHQAVVTASHTSYICHKRGLFYLSHLSAYFTNVNKHSMLESPMVFADSFFKESDVARFLDATRPSFFLRSQQALVDVASRGPSSSSSRPLRFCPRCSPTRSSPARRHRRDSDSPAHPSKKVHFDSPAPSSALKSPSKSHFWE